MSETVKGKLEEIAIIKKGRSPKGPWAITKITVDGEKYSTFEKVKAALGSIVQFEAEENDNGYLDVAKGTFEVIKEASPEEHKETKKAAAQAMSSTNTSIENQVALKAAVEFCAQFKVDSDAGLVLVSKAYKQFSGLLHPFVVATAAKAEPNGGVKPKAKKPVEAEDENQDEGEEEQAPDY